MGEGETRFIKPLSLEAIAALIVAFINLALDQADIHIMLLSWLSVAACIALCIDALRRTQWIGKAGIASGRFIGISLAIAVSFVAFGVFLGHHGNHAAEVEQRAAVGEAPKQDKPLGRSEPPKPVPPQPTPQPKTTSHRVEHLSELVLEGVQLKEQYQFRVCATGTSAEVLGKFVADINDWHHRVELYLEKMGVLYSARFRHQASPPPSYPCAFDLNYHNAYGVWNSLSSDLERLTEFIKELTATAESTALKKQSGVSTSGENSPAVGSVTQGAGSAFSVNQRGGITAGTVIVGQQSRLLSVEKIEVLASELSTDRGTVTITMVNPSGDTSEYAAQWSSVFIKAQWSAGAPNTRFAGTSIGSDGLPIPFPRGLHIYADRNVKLAKFLWKTITYAGVDCQPVEHEDNLGDVLELIVGNQ